MFDRFTLLHKLFYMTTKSSQEKHTLKFQFSDWVMKHQFLISLKHSFLGLNPLDESVSTQTIKHTPIPVNISFFFRNIVDHNEDVQKLFYNNLQLLCIYQTSI